MISPGVICLHKPRVGRRIYNLLIFCSFKCQASIAPSFLMYKWFQHLWCFILFIEMWAETEEKEKWCTNTRVVNKGNYFADTHRQPLTCRQEQTERQRTYWARNCIRIYSVPGFLLRWQLIELLFCLFKRKKRSKIATKKGKERE